MSMIERVARANPVLETSGFTVTEKSMRPASDKRECFYCQQPIGAEHTKECVLVHKRVTVRLTVEFDIEVPAHWDAGMVEFARNESSWCADNVVDELARHVERLEETGGCLCDSTRIDFVADSDVAYLREE